MSMCLSAPSGQIARNRFTRLMKLFATPRPNFRADERPHAFKNILVPARLPKLRTTGSRRAAFKSTTDRFGLGGIGTFVASKM